MKYIRVTLILLFIVLISCEKKENVSPNSDSDLNLKNAQDSTGLINIEVDSTFIDTVVIVLNEDTTIIKDQYQ